MILAAENTSTRKSPELLPILESEYIAYAERARPGIPLAIASRRDSRSANFAEPPPAEVKKRTLLTLIDNTPSPNLYNAISPRQQLRLKRKVTSVMIYTLAMGRRA